MSEALSPFLMPEAQLEARRLSIGGSDANTIMSGDPERLMSLWEEKLGRGKPQEPTLNMLMGTATEDLNAAWFTHITGKAVVCRGEVVSSSNGSFPSHATLDGTVTMESDAVFEAKHTSGYDFQLKDKRSAGSMAEYYFPQLQHNMMVTGLKRAILSVFFDNNRHEWIEIEADPFYQDGLAAAEKKFWQHVIDKTPPVASSKLEAKPKVIATKSVDFTGNNEWANFAGQWLENKAAAALYDDASSKLKAMVEADVMTAKGHSVIAKRDKKGSIRIYSE